jgi:hypothetical protein
MGNCTTPTTTTIAKMHGSCVFHSVVLKQRYDLPEIIREFITLSTFVFIAMLDGKVHGPSEMSSSVEPTSALDPWREARARKKQTKNFVMTLSLDSFWLLVVSRFNTWAHSEGNNLYRQEKSESALNDNQNKVFPFIPTKHRQISAYNTYSTVV